MSKEIIRIQRSQIEIEDGFILFVVLTTLWYCHLQVENLEWIMMVVKNWLNDPWLINCTTIVNLKDYMKIEYALGEKNSNLIEKIVFLNNYKLIAIKSPQPSLLFFFFFLYLTNSSKFPTCYWISIFVMLQVSLFIYGFQRFNNNICCWSMQRVFYFFLGF